MPSSAVTASVTRRWISLRSGQPATVRATRMEARAVVGELDVADHAEVDDRPVQLGILDGAEDVDDLVGSDGHADPSMWVVGPGTLGRN